MGGERKGPRARDRIVGARLKAIRKERTDITLEDTAERARWSPSTQSRIENGKRYVSTEDVATLATIYGLTAAERAELVEAARSANSAGWWDRPLPGVPMDMGTLASYEAEAVRLTDWSVNVVPGLLQTYHYAIGFMKVDGVDPSDIETRWMARLRRQQILGTVDYTAFIGEAALRTPFGGPEALHDQLRHLLTARNRGIRVRVVPEHVPTGVVIHSWLLMEFPNTTPVVNVEVRNGSMYLHDEAAETYFLPLRKLDEAALSASASVAKLKSALEEV